MGSLHLRFSESGATPAQAEFLDALFRSHVYAAGFVGGYASGKTKALGVASVMCAAANPCLPGLVVAPTYGMLKDAVIPTVLRELDANGIPYTYRDGGGRPEIALPAFGNAVIWFRSGENPDRLKGQNAAWGLVDEPGLCKEAVWQNVCARVREPRAKHLALGACGTPEGLNWFYDYFGTGREGYHTVHARTADNRALRPEYLEQLTEALDAQHAKAYLDGHFVPLWQRQVYYNWSRPLHMGRNIELNPDLPLFWAHDFNVNPMCSVIYQMPRTGGVRRPDVWVCDEIVIPNSNSPEAAREFLARYGDVRWPMLFLQGDPAGRARDTRQESARSDFDIIAAALNSAMPMTHIEQDISHAAPAVRRRHNTVNALLKNARGEVSLYVHPRCRGLAQSFERTVHKEGTGIVDKDAEWKFGRQTYKGPEHLTDAIGYGVCRHFPDIAEVRSEARAA